MKANIINVEIVEKFGESRIMIQTDTTFENFDKEQKKVTTDTFGTSQKHLFSAQCSNKIFTLMKAMRVGRTVEAGYLGLLLVGAEIEFNVKLEKAGKVVRGTTLEKDTYVTTIESLVLHIDKDFEKLLLNERASWYKRNAFSAVAPNPFA